MVSAVEPLSPVKREQYNEECTVSGVHAFVLRVSSIFGMAPLRFKSHGNGYTVSLSNYMTIYSYLLATVLAVITFVGVGLNLTLGVTISMHMNSFVPQAVFICDVIMVPIMAGIGVYGAPSRMRGLLEFMETIASVDKSIGALYSPAKERWLWVALIYCMCFLTGVKVHDVYYSLMQSGASTIQWDMLIHHLLWYQVLIFEVQFAFTVMAVQTRFEAVNEALSLTARHLSLSNTQKAKSQETLNVIPVKVTASESQFKNATVIVTKSVTGEPRLVLCPSDAIHRIASLHNSLCDVVACVDQCYSSPLILILISTLLHLIVTPYFIHLEIITQKPTRDVYFLILEVVWVVLLIQRLFMVVEPCHYTVVEGKKTESLVFGMLQVSPTSGPLPARLELFSRQLMMQSLSYNPMGLCTLDRPLIASPEVGDTCRMMQVSPTSGPLTACLELFSRQLMMQSLYYNPMGLCTLGKLFIASIFGVVTTYLVILIQFQKTDA